MMIRNCAGTDIDAINKIINEASWAYRGNIPDDCYHEPYMNLTDLESEINAGVDFWGWEECDVLVGVMGIQKVHDVTLIRHAYVSKANQGKGIGSRLLSFLMKQTTGPLLVGTWAGAYWAIGLYERHGFSLVPTTEKDRLLSTYWNISERQKETSVVLTQIC